MPQWSFGARLFRGAVSALVGAMLALPIILRLDMKRYAGPSYILPAVLCGALIGGLAGFFRNRV
jgi:hypothetical protein